MADVGCMRRTPAPLARSLTSLHDYSEKVAAKHTSLGTHVLCPFCSLPRPIALTLAMCGHFAKQGRRCLRSRTACSAS